MLQPAKDENSETNTGPRAAREKTKLKQVGIHRATYCLRRKHELTTLNLPICRYIPSATGAIYGVLKEMSRSQASKKRRYEDKDEDLLRQVSAKLVTEETLREKLAEHVEQVELLPIAMPTYAQLRQFFLFPRIYRTCRVQCCLQVDYEMALEYATHTGVNEEPREDIYIPALGGEYKFTDFYSPVFVFRLVH